MPSVPPSGLQSRMPIRSLGYQSLSSTASPRETVSKRKATRIRRGLICSAEKLRRKGGSLTGFHYSGILINLIPIQESYPIEVG